MERAKIIFSVDGRSAYIRMPNGKETDYFESKMEIIENLYLLEEIGKINEEDKENMIIEVLKNEKMFTKTTFSGFSAYLPTDENAEIVLSEINCDKITVAMCDCLNRTPHANFMHKDIFLAGPFEAKSYGILIIKILKNTKVLNDECSNFLELAIETLNLPD